LVLGATFSAVVGAEALTGADFACLAGAAALAFGAVVAAGFVATGLAGAGAGALAVAVGVALLAAGAAGALEAEGFGTDLEAVFFKAGLAEGVVFFEVTEARGFRFSPFEEVV
jgi:hypothetical protein